MCCQEGCILLLNLHLFTWFFFLIFEFDVDGGFCDEIEIIKIVQFGDCNG